MVDFLSAVLMFAALFAWGARVVYLDNKAFEAGQQFEAECEKMRALMAEADALISQLPK